MNYNDLFSNLKLNTLIIMRTLASFNDISILRLCDMSIF